MERREPPQRVAADVAEYLGIFIFAGDLCQCRIHVAVAATLAQCGRTGDDDAAGGEGRVRGEPQGRAYAVRSQFPGAGQFARHAAADLNGRRQDAAQGFFDDGLSLLDDEQRLAFRRHAAHEFLRQRVLRYFEHRVRASVGIVLREVVVGDAAGDDAQRFVFSIGVTVEGACGRLLFEAGIVGEQCLVSYARIARHQHPLARPGGIGEAVLGACLARFDHGARVGHAGRKAHQYGDAVFFREIERGLHHLVGLLLRGGLERRDKGELAVEA